MLRVEKLCGISERLIYFRPLNLQNSIFRFRHWILKNQIIDFSNLTKSVLRPIGLGEKKIGKLKKS